MASQRDPHTGEKIVRRVSGDDADDADSVTRPILTSAKSAVRQRMAGPGAEAGPDQAEDGLTLPVLGAGRASDRETADLTTGWLVLISQPGRGRSFRLGPGRNSIGKGRGNAVCLDHGDPGISSEGHVSITWDYQGKRFVLRDSGSRNPVYLNGEMVVDAQQLKADDTIRIGATDLVFVPFCRPDRNWD